MREIQAHRGSEGATFAASLATILELPLDAVPEPPPEEEPAGWRISRWLGGLGLGLVPVADAAAFSWPGPWIGRFRSAAGRYRAVVMYGVPSGVVFDPAGVGLQDDDTLVDGFVIAAADIALARPQRPRAPTTVGQVKAIHVAPHAGAPARSLTSARALAGRGLDGDRHVTGDGTFPSRLPGSALTLIEDEVCASFSPPLSAGEHRRNVVTHGIDLNALVGCEFTIGAVCCRGMRLCEPCTVIDGYSPRRLLRALVHRGGLRADILEDGTIHRGDPVSAR